MIAQSKSPEPVPLCVDLDGTLIRSDLLLESALMLVRTSPMTALAMPFWLIWGKAHLKARIARHVDLRTDLLPANSEVVELMELARRNDRPVVMATASTEKFANQIAKRFGPFDAVYTSDESNNLSATAKAGKLVDAYGMGAFDYVANGRPDLLVWKLARQAIVIDPEVGVLTRLRKLGIQPQLLHGRGNLLHPLIQAIRPHQWLKNVLLFLPILTAHLYSDGSALLAASLAFIAFCMAASAGYLVNDLLDLEADRLHPRKRFRPFAAGDLPLSLGIAMIPLLILASFGIATMLPSLFVAVLAVYLVVNLAYSLYLKQRPGLDVLILAILYTLRIIAGTAALALAFSFWLLAFSMFLFLSLAFVKRFAELKALEQDQRDLAPGRGYTVDDLELVRSLGISAGFSAVLVMSLYVNSPEISVLYGRPELIWLICPIVLYWIARVWTITHKGLMHDDPVVFAIEDRVSQFCALLSVIIVWLAV